METLRLLGGLIDRLESGIAEAAKKHLAKRGAPGVEKA